MSNRRKLEGGDRAAIKASARCPDCASTVRVGRRRGRVWHSEGCPTLRAMRRQGREVTYAIVGGQRVALPPGFEVAPSPYAALDRTAPTAR